MHGFEFSFQHMVYIRGGYAALPKRLPRIFALDTRRPHRLVWPRTPAFHAGDTGSNPVGVAIFLCQGQAPIFHGVFHCIPGGSVSDRKEARVWPRLRFRTLKQTPPATHCARRNPPPANSFAERHDMDIPAQQRGRCVREKPN